MIQLDFLIKFIEDVVYVIAYAYYFIKILFFDPEIVNTTKITFLFLRKNGALSNNFVKQNFISFLMSNVLFL